MPNEGVLIHDDNPDHRLLDRVLAAARSHAKKFGTVANIIYVHPSALGTELTTVAAGLPVVARRWMLKHHYYAVREEPMGGGWLARVRREETE